MRAVGAVARVVVIARIPSDSLRSTWVEPGHARRLGRMESEGTGLFCPSCARPARCLVMRARFPHGSVVDPCGNRSLLGWLCRTRLGEGQNRPSATIGNVKDSDWGAVNWKCHHPTQAMRHIGEPRHYIRQLHSRRPEYTVAHGHAPSRLTSSVATMAGGLRKRRMRA